MYDSLQHLYSEEYQHFPLSQQYLYDKSSYVFRILRLGLASSDEKSLSYILNTSVEGKSIHCCFVLVLGKGRAFSEVEKKR